MQRWREKWGNRAYNEAHAEADARYDEKAYKQINIRFRKEDDADIIKSIESLQARGQNRQE